MNNDLFNQYFPGQDPDEIMKLLKSIPTSSYDMNISDTTVSMEGRPESLPSQSGRVPVSPSIPEIPAIPAAPVTSPPAPTVPPTTSPKVPGKTLMTSEGINPLDILTQSKSQDQEARTKMQESERSKHLWGTIPVALGGIADAIGYAAAPYGGRGTSGAGTKAAEMLETGAKGRKTQFEENLKNDSTSQISKHYQDVLTLMMGDKADPEKIKNLSAAQIATTLPEVEKFMMKQLGMEQIKASREASQASKELALSEKEEQFDERQKERLGAKVNNLNAGSRKALGVATINNLRADRFIKTTDQKTISSQDYSNLVADLQGIYKGGVPDQVMLQHGDYTSIQRKASEILGMITGKPQNVNTPEIKQHLLELTKDIKEIDNKVITGNLGIEGAVYSRLIKKYPEWWEEVKNQVIATTELPEDTAGQAPAATTPGTSTTTQPTQIGRFKVTVR